MPIQIAIDCSNYFADNHNNGDLAIFRSTFELLRRCWPDCEVSFVTRAPNLVEAATSGRGTSVPASEDYTRRWAPSFAASDPVQDLRETHRDRKQRRLGRERLLERLAGAVAESDRPGLVRSLTPLARADLFVLSGGGWYSDSFAAHAAALLDRAEIALRLGVPVAVLGAGFEPVSDPTLTAISRRVLPALDLVACREGTWAPGYLAALGLEPGRVVVSGDLALGLVAEDLPPGPGTHLGLAVRATPYSGIGLAELRSLAGALRRFAAHRRPTPLVEPITISAWGPADLDAIATVCSGAGLRLAAESPQRSPEAVLEALGRCRSVLAGSYHAAFLALAAGIPTVTFAGAAHYRFKLAGCAALFGSPPPLEPARGTFLSDRLDAAWNASGDVRAKLREGARRQRAMQAGLGERLRELIADAAPEPRAQPTS